MFDPQDTPRLFALPPGVDFAQALVAGLRARLSGKPPESMARIEIFVNAPRLARQVRAVFDAGPPGLLPRIRLVTDLADPVTAAQLPQAVPPLRRRLELTGLVARLLETQPDLAPRAALFDLSDSLARLMDEMIAENVSPQAIESLDVADQSGHWQRALRFFRIVQQFVDADAAPDTGGLQRLALAARLAAWTEAPPRHPVIVAGSTGSRGTTHAFMRAVARLPQGAVVLPGFDPDMPDAVWAHMGDALQAEDHPQFRLGTLMRDLGITPSSIAPWTGATPPASDRNKVISLALRPAPVTHQWLSDGPRLPALPDAMARVTLLEAQTPREEALAIALRLRQAAEDGIRAALITPDRMLTRQVTAALSRWDLLPDDSAGIPAHLTPPGRLLRHVAALFTAPLTAEALLTLLKHPLTHTGGGRGPHLLHTRDLELHIRRKGMPYPSPAPLLAWAATQKADQWGDWLVRAFCDRSTAGTRPLSDWVADHLALAEALANGSAPEGASGLWAQETGRALQAIMTELRDEAGHGTAMSARDYADLVGALLASREVRNPDDGHPDILIWGTLEARAADAELVILGSLNEGAWPEAPKADPWLNRKMRAEAGLLLPERQVGLSAHDFQMAVAAPEVWLSRALKSDEAETVPSRWVNRLLNLMNGLPERQGPAAVKAMQNRGKRWLALCKAAEAPIVTPPARRPAPAPPSQARPNSLSVTQIKTLVRDPYAIYARKTLRLEPLQPIQRAPDALLRGILVHALLETYVKASVDDPALLTPEAFNALAAQRLSDPDTLPFPTVRALWMARLMRVSDWFTATEADRQALARPVHHEISGESLLPDLGFTLRAKADRIDLDAGGLAYLYDYKTGAAPGAREQKHFDKQLLLEAAMVENGDFKGLGPVRVARADYLSLAASKPKAEPAPLDETPPAVVWAEFHSLVAAYLNPDQGFAARRALQKDDDVSDYDHLARYGEWDMSDPAQTERLT